MGKCSLLGLFVVVLMSAVILCGCVERKLTINTRPQGALVALNDEEIGLSPVTVSFNWYGDYNVRIIKDGFETLNTHRELKGPWYDKFPYDFFVQLLSPKRIEDCYEWTFRLEAKRQISREKLIEGAERLKQEL